MHQCTVIFNIKTTKLIAFILELYLHSFSLHFIRLALG